MRMSKAFIFISPSPSARPANVAGPRLSVTGAFNVESQPLAFPDVVWIDARRLQRADVKKHIRTAGIVCAEAVATLSIPHFKGSCSHCALSPFRLRQIAPGLAEFGWSFRETPAPLSSFFRRRRGIDNLFDRR